MGFRRCSLIWLCIRKINTLQIFNFIQTCSLKTLYIYDVSSDKSEVYFHLSNYLTPSNTMVCNCQYRDDPDEMEEDEDHPPCC